MADITAIRDALGDAVETLSTTTNPLAVQRFPGGQVHTPCVVIEPGEVDFSGSMQRGTEKWEFWVRILVSTAFGEGAHRDRDKFFGGVFDVKDAIESHVPLRDGSVAHDVFVHRARKFDAWTYQGVAYLGVEVTVDVYA